MTGDNEGNPLDADLADSYVMELLKEVKRLRALTSRP
jgi:hypothetical protein